MDVRLGSFSTGTRPAAGRGMSPVHQKAEVKISAWASASTRADGIARCVIQAPKPEPRIMRYELTDYEWTAIKPFLPNKPRGVPCVNDRRVLNGIFWVLRSGAPWRDLPQSFGPYTTCYNRFVRWRRAGVWSQVMEALAGAHDGDVQMIDTSIVRVHQHAACIARNERESPWVGHEAG